MINRFSRGPIAADVQSEFVPLPLDLIDRQLDRRQGYFDEAKTTIGTAQETWHGVQGVPADTETLRNITSEYDQRILDQLNTVGGDYSQLNSFADELGMDLAKNIRSGYLGGIHRNFIIAQTEAEKLGKLRDENKISEASYNRRLSEIGNFVGTRETPAGGFTTLTVSRPPENMDITMHSDELATYIADQYKRGGEQFIDGKVAAEHVFRDLIATPQTVEIARDEVWAEYGELSPEEENQKVLEHLWGYAERAGNKVAYEQRFRPFESTQNQGTANPFGIPDVFTQEYVVDRTAAVRFTTGNNIAATIQDAAKGRRVGSALNVVRNAWGAMTAGAALANSTTATNNILGMASTLELSLGDMTTNPQVALSKYQEATQEGKNTLNKKSYDVLRNLMEQDIFKHIAENAGVDINKFKTEWPTNDIRAEAFPTLINVLEQMNIMDSHKANVQVSSSLDPKADEFFKRYINTAAFMSAPLYDFDTGIKLTEKEKQEMWRNHTNDDNRKITYMGVVTTPGQMYQQGSAVAHFLDGQGDNAKLRRITWVPQKVNTNTEDFIRDRSAAALQFGIASFKDENGNQIHFMPNKDETKIHVFENGKATRTMRILR